MKKTLIIALLLSTLTLTVACNKQVESQEDSIQTDNQETINNESDNTLEEQSEEVEQIESNLSKLKKELEQSGEDISKWSVALDDIEKMEAIAKENGLIKSGYNISKESYYNYISVWYDKDDERSESIRYKYTISTTDAHSPIGEISYFYNIPGLGAIEGVDITSQKVLASTLKELVSKDYNFNMLQENYNSLVSDIVGGSYKEKSDLIEGNNTGEYDGEKAGLYISYDSPTKDGELNERQYFYMYEISK